MPMNLMQQADVLKNLSDVQLQSEMQQPTGGAAPFMVAAEISRRKDMRERYANEMARRQPQTTVVDDLMASAQPAPAFMAGSMPSAGLDAGLAPEAEGYAEGGLVGGIDYDSLIKRYQDRLDALPARRDQAAALALISTGAGIMGAGHSNTLRNVGVGAQKGLDAYAQSLDAINLEDTNATRGLVDLFQTQQQQRRLSEANYGNTPIFFIDDKERQRIGQPSSSGGFLIEGQMYPGVPPGWRVVARPDTYDIVDTGDAKRVWNPNTGQFEDIAVPVQGTPSTDMNVSIGPDGRSMTPAPGSKEALERKAAAEKAALGEEAAALTADIVTQDIDRAVAQINDNPFFTTGVGALFTQDLGAGPGADVKRLIETVKANVSFDKLQQMRAASPTGAALGPVSDFENRLLQATIGNLELSQNKDQLIQNLQRVKDIYTRIVNEGISDPASLPKPTTQAEFDALEKGARYIDPDDGQEYVKN